jgi:hypothetical protein
MEKSRRAKRAMNRARKCELESFGHLTLPSLSDIITFFICPTFRFNQSGCDSVEESVAAQLLPNTKIDVPNPNILIRFVSMATWDHIRKLPK